MENITNPKELHRPRGTQYFAEQKSIKDAMHSIHGFYLFGKIEGLDFTVEGKMEDGTKYGNTLKLKFSQAVPATKQLGNDTVQILVYKSQLIKIPCDSKDHLAEMVKEYTSQIGKNVVIELNVPDNQNYKALSINSY